MAINEAACGFAIYEGDSVRCIFCFLLDRGGKCWAIAWLPVLLADMLSRFKCTFDSLTCQDVANTRMNSCEILDLMPHQVFFSLPNGCCRINWCRGLNFAKASVGMI